MKTKKYLQILLVFLLSVGGLYLALRGVDFRTVGRALRTARWGWILLTPLCALGSFLLRAFRWRLLLDDKLTVLEAFGLINIGYLVSNIFPLRAGDPARAVAASLRSPVSAMAALSTVVVERTLDLLTVVLFLVVTLPFIAGMGNTVTTGLLSGAAALLLLVTLVLMALFPDQVEALARWFLERLPLGDPERWLKPLRGILEGLQALRSPRKGAALALYSLGIWAGVVAYYIALLYALLATPPPPVLAALVLTWTTALGMAAPTPGGIGGYHFAARLALTLPFGVSDELAATYGLLAHAITYVVGVVLGAGAMLLWGLSFQDIRRSPPDAAAS
jgi:uncharacterized protein (TIRG00374 family)